MDTYTHKDKYILKIYVYAHITCITYALYIYITCILFETILNLGIIEMWVRKRGSDVI